MIFADLPMLFVVLHWKPLTVADEYFFSWSILPLDSLKLNSLPFENETYLKFLSSVLETRF